MLMIKISLKMALSQLVPICSALPHLENNEHTKVKILFDVKFAKFTIESQQEQNIICATLPLFGCQILCLIYPEKVPYILLKIKNLN